MAFPLSKRGLAAVRWRSLSCLRAVVLAATWCAFTHSARSAPPKTLPRSVDGEGIKVGERSHFHPGFALGFGFDGNVFYDAPEENPVRAAFMVATGWLGVGNREVRDGILDKPPERTNRKLDYNVAVILGIRQYLDRRPKILRQSRFSAGTELHFSILPGRRFTIDFDDSFYRLAEPRNVQAGSDSNFNRVTNDGQLLFTLRPGGGRVSISAGYLNGVLYFENRDFQIGKNDRVVNGALAQTQWRFLPRSSLYARYTMRHTYYLSCCAEPGTGRNEDNFHHQVSGGYQGQVFKKLTAGAEFGWGWGFYRQDPNGPDFKGPLAKLTLDYFPTLRTRLHLSGQRSVRDALFGNFMVDMGGQAMVSHLWRWRMLTRVGVGVIAREYRGIPVPGVEDANIVAYDGVRDGGTTRADTLVTALFGLEQPLGRLFALGLTYDVTVDRTNFAVTFADGARNEGGFVRHLVMLFGAVRY